MASLRGARVALLEARMRDEMAALVERLGGKPYCVPAVREAPLHHPAEAEAFIRALCDGRFQFVVLLTGVGVTALLREAEGIGRRDDTLAALRQTTTVCRGPKPAAVLKRHDVPVGVAAAEPYTTAEVLEALRAVDLAGKAVGLVHYGERSEAIARGLTERGAALTELCLYEWVLPDDVAPLETLVGELVAGTVDAVAFTSQVQSRHLFQIAARTGQSAALTDALNAQVVVAAVGPVAAAELRSHGVVPHVLPAHPKMGPLVTALADYFELTGREPAAERPAARPRPAPRSGS
jgi:uroporphyrinogen-III synthase